MPKTTGRRRSPSRQRDRVRHEEEILEAAERLFARHGYDGVTMADLAAEAGFAIATLYNIFGSKEAVLECMFARHLDALSQEVGIAVSEAGTPRERLHASVVTRARYCERNRDFFRLFASTTSWGMLNLADKKPPRAELAIQEEIARLEAIFREMPECTLDAGSRALAFYGATRAYITERVLRAQKPARPAQVGALVDALLDGLCPRS